MGRGCEASISLVAVGSTGASLVTWILKNFSDPNVLHRISNVTLIAPGGVNLDIDEIFHDRVNVIDVQEHFSFGQESTEFRLPTSNVMILTSKANDDLLSLGISSIKRTLRELQISRGVSGLLGCPIPAPYTQAILELPRPPDSGGKYYENFKALFGVTNAMDSLDSVVLLEEGVDWVGGYVRTVMGGSNVLKEPKEILGEKLVIVPGYQESSVSSHNKPGYLFLMFLKALKNSGLEFSGGELLSVTFLLPEWMSEEDVRAVIPRVLEISSKLSIPEERVAVVSGPSTFHRIMVGVSVVNPRSERIEKLVRQSLLYYEDNPTKMEELGVTEEDVKRRASLLTFTRTSRG